MHWYRIEKRNKGISSWSALTKRKSRFGVSASCSLCHLSACCLSLKAVLLIYPCVCLSCLWAPVYVCCVLWCDCPWQRACSIFIEQHRKHLTNKKWDTLQESSTDFDKGLSYWLQLIPIYPDNKDKHCLSANTHNLSTFMVDFRKLLSTSVLAPSGYTCILQVRGMEE